MPHDIKRLLSRKDDPGATLLEVQPTEALAQGQVRMEIDCFALTTNNITYAAYGDSIGYWQVFPTAREGYGAMPVWGFAQVVESLANGVQVGTRVWGYFPIADSLTVIADKVTGKSFMDGALNRAAVPAVYSRYVRADGDPHYRQQYEALQMLYRPLFITSYTAVDFLLEAELFGARQVVISSASSKTAYGVAWCLREAGVPLIGLTSNRNQAFVESLGCYDEVIEYDAIEQLSPDLPTLYVDLASDPALRARVHRHWKDCLVYDCLIGSTRSDSFPDATDLPGPAPRFFFAAERLDQHRDQGTIHAFLDRFERDQLAFIERAADPASPWIRIVEEDGLESAANIIRELADGCADPGLGHVVRLGLAPRGNSSGLA